MAKVFWTEIKTKYVLACPIVIMSIISRIWIKFIRTFGFAMIFMRTVLTQVPLSLTETRRTYGVTNHKPDMIDSLQLIF